MREASERCENLVKDERKKRGKLMELLGTDNFARTGINPH